MPEKRPGWKSTLVILGITVLLWFAFNHTVVGIPFDFIMKLNLITLGMLIMVISFGFGEEVIEVCPNCGERIGVHVKIGEKLNRTGWALIIAGVFLTANLVIVELGLL